MRKKESEFKSGFRSGAGATGKNKMVFASLELEKMACWIVAERLDSWVEKESAKLAVDQILEEFAIHPTLSKAKIKEYLEKAHRRLIAESNHIFLKVNLTMVVTDYSKIVWAVAGNIRLYHLRQGTLNFRSKDQTLAQVMLDAGNFTEDELNGRYERKGLINFLGTLTEFKPFISQPFLLQDEDVLLLCNVGYWENMGSNEIAQVFSESNGLEEHLDNLQTALLKKKKDAHNYIMAVITANKTFKTNILDDVKEFGKTEVILPVLLMASLGSLVTYHTETVNSQQALKAQKRTVVARNQISQNQEKFTDSVGNTEKIPEQVQATQELPQVQSAQPDLTQEELNLKAIDNSLQIADRDVEGSAAKDDEPLITHSPGINKMLDTGASQKTPETKTVKTINITHIVNSEKEKDNKVVRHNDSGIKTKILLPQNIAEQNGLKNPNLELKTVIAPVEPVNSEMGNAKLVAELEKLQEQTGGLEQPKEFQELINPGITQPSELQQEVVGTEKPKAIEEGKPNTTEEFKKPKETAPVEQVVNSGNVIEHVNNPGEE